MQRVVRIVAIVALSLASATCGADAKPINTAAFMPLPEGFEVAKPLQTKTTALATSATALYFVVKITADEMTVDDGVLRIRQHLLDHGFVAGNNSKLKDASGAIASIYKAADYAGHPRKGAKKLNELTDEPIDVDRALVLTVTKFRLG